MPVSFTASGYIEVTLNGALVSRHRVEREAIESCSKQGPGTYVLTYPQVTAIVTADAVAGEPPAVGAVVLDGAMALP